MTSSLVFWLLVAVLMFWSLGAYNRLVRLRAQVMGLFAQVDQRMVQALALLGEASALPDAPAAGVALDDAAAATTVRAGLQAAAIQFEVALRVVRKQVLDASAMAALQTAYATVHVVWDRHHAASAIEPASTAMAVMQRAWEDNAQAVRDVEGSYNAAAQAYNAAIAQFPANILAYLFSFSAAATL